ncbi:hypothetical protein ACIKTA_13055, partial [Hansschlegelia beijingensis]
MRLSTAMKKPSVPERRGLSRIDPPETQALLRIELWPVKMDATMTEMPRPATDRAPLMTVEE